MFVKVPKSPRLAPDHEQPAHVVSGMYGPVQSLESSPIPLVILVQVNVVGLLKVSIRTQHEIPLNCVSPSMIPSSSRNLEAPPSRQIEPTSSGLNKSSVDSTLHRSLNPGGLGFWFGIGCSGIEIPTLGL